MILTNLTVLNFGVFNGKHEFHLEPSHRNNGNLKHLVIFTGQNGAGKSTLFRAIGIALFGKLFLGDRVSHQAYCDYLYSYFHRCKCENKIELSNEAGVEISFQYTQSGRLLNIDIKRNWRRTNNTVYETLEIFENGKSLEIESTEYQYWLNDLIPTGISKICFFDAEDFDNSISPDTQNNFLEEILRRLLGLDLVNRLQKDLDYYNIQASKGINSDNIRKDVVKQQNILDNLDKKIAIHNENIDSQEKRQEKLEDNLQKLQERLIAEGGAYAEKRPQMEETKKVLSNEIEKCSNHIREFCGELLPFALAPELCVKLKEQLESESNRYKQEIAEDLWKDKLQITESELGRESFWKGINISGKDRTALRKKITGFLQLTADDKNLDQFHFIHNIADNEQEQLNDWINKVIHVTTQQAKQLGDQLHKLKSEHNKINNELKKAPQEEIIKPLTEKIRQTEKSLHEVLSGLQQLIEKKGSLQFQYQEQERKLFQLTEQLKSIETNERQIILARQSKIALRAYYDALVRQRLELLETHLLSSFNAICRKKHLLASITINPETFCVQLKNKDGHVLGLNDFSAGESQLYILALLSALREIGGRELPLIIDMPFARLDDNHQTRLIKDYIPFVSKQVILFVTDAELSSNFLAQAKSHISQTYRLNFDQKNLSSVSTCDHISAHLNHSRM